MIERRLLSGLMLLACVSVFYHFAYTAPRAFPSDKIITLEKGLGLSELSYKLERESIIRSPFWFRLAAITLGAERRVQAGDYYLGEPEGGVSLAWRMIYGHHNLTVVRITIPEGFTTKEIVNLFDSRFTLLNKEELQALAEEGYMFPDTYFIPVNATAQSVVELLKNNFALKTKALHPSYDTIIMASIVEAEVTTSGDKAHVSGILWKRLKIGMALQVDPAPETYKTTGLPKKPINNPGLVSIEAALNPQNSPYLYFMSGKDGKTYYAKTIEEHLANVKKYL